MLKMKIELRRLICYILIMAIVMSAIPLSHVSATTKRDTIKDKIKEAVEEEFGENKEYAEEAYLDCMERNTWQEWYYACKDPNGDHLPWNYFHNKVQKQVREDNALFARKELSLTLESGKLGRADLYVEKENNRYLWEVKPASFKDEPNKSRGLTQLQGYIDVTSKDKSSTIFKHKNGSESGIKIPGGKINTGKYIITYGDAGNGLILYQFKRNPDPTPTPSRKPKPPSSIIGNPSSKDNAKDDLADGTDSSSKIRDQEGDEDDGDDEGDIAAIIIEVGAYMAIAGTVYAACKLISKYVSSAHALELASIGFIASATEFMENPTVAAAKEIQSEMDDYALMIEAFYGMDLANAYREAMNTGDQDKVDEIIRMIQGNSGAYEDAGEAQPPRDPLIIDFGAEGITLKSLEHGVNFDLDNNGFAEKTAWIGTEDGFLALDRNGNGKIDNGGELFGDQVIMKDGAKSTSGFVALKELDDKENGKIDSNDNAYDQLRVWIDANHNGKSESSELKSLKETGIVSISLDYHEVSLVDDETGTRIAETADVLMRNGDAVTTTQISEFWFPVNSSDTTQGDVVTAGNVPDILQAIDADDSGELFDLCMQFVSLNDAVSKRYYLKKILYYITGAEDISAGSRGGNIDARDLRVIEQFMGREFTGVDGSNNPNVNAAAILREIYMDIENQYYNLMNIYAALGGYLKGVYEYEDANGNKKLELSFLFYVIDSKIDDRDDVDTLLYDLGVYLSSFDRANGTDYYGSFSKKYSAVSSYYADIIARSGFGTTYLGTDQGDSYSGTIQNDFIFGLEGNDTLSGANGNDCIDGGSGNDTLSGGAGNDDLSGKEGNDTLDGEAGNDILKGGKGDDTYIFAKGYGNDTVIDIDGQNTLCFKGLSVKDVRVNGTDEQNATVHIKGTNDTLVISNFCKGEEYRNYKLKFEDASMHAVAENSPFHFIYGEDGDDVLKAVVDDSYLYGFKGDDSITGSDGNDVIYGNQGDDSIYAGKGEDKVFGGAGDDILDGGEGNDFLYGGKGNDTYLFGKSYGTDIINDSIGESTIQLTESLSLSDITIYSVGEDAVIRMHDTEDKLIISGYLKKQENYFLKIGDEKVLLMEHVTDGDGKSFSGSDSSDYYVNESKEIIAGGKGSDRIIGTKGMEYVFGDSGNDQLLTSDGNDVVFSGTGNDYISAGDGDDYVDAGAGDDFADGGNGDDCYIFCPGYGKDSIMDCDGKNMVLFGDGCKADAIKAYRSNWNDLLITFDGLDDTLNIKNYCISENARDFNLVFADGTIVNATDKGSPLRTIYGTDGSEYMTSIYADGITKIGQDGDDQLVGSYGDDFLYGGKGNDRITGNGGKDVLDGGEGDDYLYGGEGDDTYIFKPGYGTDTIGDGKGVNAIDIYGYTQGQIKAYRTNWNNLTITFEDSDDKLVIEGFFNSEADRNYYLTFSGGSRIHATASDSPLRTIYGTNDSEYIVAMDDRGVTIYGESGDDNLNGGNGADKLYGGNGADRLNGNSGNDILDGGKGNDYLHGGAGKDTYIFNKGYGTDTIIDSEGVNTISFGNGLPADQLTAYRTNWNDLTVTFKDVTDKLIINGYFTSESNRKFNVQFANGLHFAFDDAENPIKQVHATEYDDWMNAWSDDGIILYGDKGNDHLTGGKGADTLCGGKGNDYLSGNKGNDTYIFGEGYGSDTIEDSDGNNLVVFDGLALNKVTFQMKANGNLVISLKGSEDTLTIKNFSSDLYLFEFANGVTGTVNADTGEITKIAVE